MSAEPHSFSSYAAAAAAAASSPECKGITKEADDRYTLRVGTELHDSPTGEVSWLKVEAVLDAVVAELGGPLVPDPCLTVLGGLAPLLEALLATGTIDTEQGIALCRMACELDACIAGPLILGSRSGD